jgi:RimJ/RimL family protein N-acetyltransferase
MFARTKRLTLRPAWPEDAVPLVQAIGHEAVARMLRYVPFPYGLSDATAFCTQPRHAAEACFLIIAHDRAVPTLIGGIAIDRGDGDPLLGYWLTPSAWGRGYATEAGRAVIDMARHGGRGAAQARVPVNGADRNEAIGRTDGCSSGGELRSRSGRAMRADASRGLNSPLPVVCPHG